MACDSVLQIGHILGHNGARRKFYRKNSKMSLWWSAAKHFLKTMIARRLTVFSKLVIITLVMGFHKNLKEKFQSVGFMKGTKKLGENKDWEACDSTFQIGNLFGRNEDQRDFYR